MPIKYICDVCGKETNHNYKNVRLNCRTNIRMTINITNVKITKPVEDKVDIGNEIICKTCLIKSIDDSYVDYSDTMRS